VEKKDIHFIGFLANVDDSILKLDLGQPFLIQKKSQGDIRLFLNFIEKHWGIEEWLSVSAMEKKDYMLLQGESFYCVTARKAEFFESTPQGGVVIRLDALKKMLDTLRDKVRLLRLFKEGNIVMVFSLFYHLQEEEIKVFWSSREWPFVDRTLFKLENNEVDQSQDFINRVKMPFEKNLQLAFESFELSYENHSEAMSFLSLMIAIEVMFNRGKQDELRYSISRNAAVLLGKDKNDYELVFK
jgi:hypothetical protein